MGDGQQAGGIRRHQRAKMACAADRNAAAMYYAVWTSSHEVQRWSTLKSTITVWVPTDLTLHARAAAERYDETLGQVIRGALRA